MTESDCRPGWSPRPRTFIPMAQDARFVRVLFFVPPRMEVPVSIFLVHFIRFVMFLGSFHTVHFISEELFLTFLVLVNRPSSVDQ